MPGVVRVGLDAHVGHASGTPNPFHRTNYVTGSPDVYVNGAKTVRIGDVTACGDPAAAGSPNVYVNNIKVHRLGDATAGHSSWVPNAASSSSTNVFANGGAGTPFEGTLTTVAGNSRTLNVLDDGCTNYDWVNQVCLDQNTDPSAPYYVTPEP